MVGSITAHAVAAAIIFSFFGMLRRAEVIALRHGDIKVFSDRIIITVQFSKTNPKPHEITLFARQDRLCPVKAWLAYCSISAISMNPSNKIIKATAQAFVVTGGKSLSYSFLNFTFKTLVDKVLQLNPKRFSIHSLRRSGATALHAVGIPDSVIKAMGRWKSLAFLKYLVISIDTIKSALSEIKA